MKNYDSLMAAQVIGDTAYCPVCGAELCRIIEGPGEVVIVCTCEEEVLIELWQD